MNGNNYIADRVIGDSVFKGNLGTVTISDGENAETYRNMEWFEGLYYTDVESPGVMYRCTRDSRIPLHNMPHDLVGHCFEIVKES